MLRWMIGLGLRLRLLIIVFAAVLLIFGITQLGDAPVDVYPEFNPPLVEVQTEALGLSAAEVEELITVPTEADLLNGVAWLDQIYSESVTGARDRPHPGPADGARAPDTSARVAKRVKTAGNASTAVGQQPGHDSRAFL
jgi:hypothetical protein